MPAPDRDEDFERYRTDDPEARERRDRFIRGLLSLSPELQREVRDEASLGAWRTALRHILAARKLTVTAADDTRIDGCNDVATLQRWHQQAAVATSTADALK